MCVSYYLLNYNQTNNHTDYYHLYTYCFRVLSQHAYGRTEGTTKLRKSEIDLFPMPSERCKVSPTEVNIILHKVFGTFY